MTGDYGYTPHIWPSLFTVPLLVALAVYSGRRRSVPGALPFMLGCLFAALWAAGSVMEYAAGDVARRIFWNNVQAVFQLPLVVAVTCFLLEFAWPGRWLTRRNLALLSVPCLLYVASILTNDQVHLAWRGFVFDGSVRPQLGPGSWIALAYACGLAMLNIVILTWLYLRSPQHRWLVAVLLTGLFGGWTIYLLEKAHILHADLPLDTLAMAFAFLAYAIVLFRFHILDPIPLAHQTAIEQLQAGMLVLDPQGRVSSLNPAAERMLGATAGRLRGRPIEELLPACLDPPLAGPGGTEIELGLPEGGQDGAGLRQYSLAVSPLKDWRGLEAGRLLLLRDVTEQKRAQAQILEQQRALAMLHEREHLARELHDSIGQVLGFASLKTEAARKLLADGKLAKADDQLARLGDIMAEAHADVRETILNLRSAPTAERPFFSALQAYLDGFRQNYGVRVECSIGPQVDASVLASETQMQLFRIVQEAFSNVRKHADADCLWLSFEREDRLVRVRIRDNGRGFDPQQVAATAGSHLGLGFMAERAEQMGGVLSVTSVPGEGTCVEVQVPVSGAAETRGKGG